MERDIAFPTPDEVKPRLRGNRSGSLTLRILAVNIVALALVAGSIFYLDGFRSRLIDERRTQQENEVGLIATVLASAPISSRPAIIGGLGQQVRDRIRMYDDNGLLLLDSWQLGPRTFRFADPEAEYWNQRVARWADAIVDRIVRARIPPPYVDQGRQKAEKWSELRAVMSEGAGVASRVRLAPDRSLVLSAAIKVPVKKPVFLLTVENAQDVTELVRAERFRLFLIVGAALALSVALSIYLARTIAQPLRRLAMSAVRVRQGRARDVVVPRLPARNDEIGMLARALSDMTIALRDRIDAVETFAADVSHELKNPLASLSSAVESLNKVSDPALRQQLLDIIGNDVHRLDRLITDIADVSRLDAQLSRSKFELVDMRKLIESLVTARAQRDPTMRFRFELAAPPLGQAVVRGDEARLARVFENLIDNALSFSPAGTPIRIGIDAKDPVTVWIEDDGPGVPPAARTIIFQRFHSDRPNADAFGRHSGLGLAIAKTIVEAHNGQIDVSDSKSGSGGARFIVSIPLDPQER
jgi:two-component system, OmpR family, sensor histidine kinase ChvG